MLICGFLAIALPLASGIGVAVVIGWLVLFSAVWHLIFAFARAGSSCDADVTKSGMEGRADLGMRSDAKARTKRRLPDPAAVE